MKKILLLVSVMLVVSMAYAQENTNQNPFKQLGSDLPTGNEYRTASGAPGAKYWQTRADYKMKITLNDEEKKIYGDQTITYHNESPDDLNYLWLHLRKEEHRQDLCLAFSLTLMEDSR